MSWKKKAYKLLQILYNYSTPKFAYSGPKISSSSRFQYKFSIVLQIYSRKKGKFPVCNSACALLKEKGWNNKSTALNQCKITISKITKVFHLIFGILSSTDSLRVIFMSKMRQNSLNLSPSG